MLKKISFILLLVAAVYTAKAQTEEVLGFVEEGVVLHNKGDFKGAIEKFEEALKIDKESALVNYEIANTYFAMQQFDDAIKYADVIINAKKEYVAQAYIIKGSALDMQSKTDDAIRAFKKGIKINPKNYLLHFNMALVAFNGKDYKTAQEAAIESIKIKPEHSTSHLLLGYVAAAQNQRTPTILAMYYFLLLEPNTTRTQSALELLNKNLSKGVTREGSKQININMPGGDDENGFRSEELMISMLEATKNIEENLGKTKDELFVKNTQSLFKMLGEVKEKKKNFWWDFYVSFFSSMATAQHTEAFCYYITQTNESEEIAKWIKENPKKIGDFSDWYGTYEIK